jgi:hypothetical protein
VRVLGLEQLGGGKEHLTRLLLQGGREINGGRAWGCERGW